MSPSNFPLTNPEVLKATVDKGGLNLFYGWLNWLDDLIVARDDREDDKLLLQRFVYIFYER